MTASPRRSTRVAMQPEIYNNLIQGLAAGTTQNQAGGYVLFGCTVITGEEKAI